MSLLGIPYVKSTTLYRDAADSDSTVWTGICPSDWKESKASNVSCQPQRAIAPELEEELPLLLQPAAATFPLTQGQKKL